MYGLVNRAIAHWLQTKVDDGAWERVRKRAEVGDVTFLSMQTYPDEVTGRLIVATAAELGREVTEVLELLGEHWVEFATEHGYSHLMRARGDSLFGFIAKLDDLHARLSVTFPELKPPSFRAVLIDDHTMRLHYVSERSGLAPFVVGLMRGLGRKFNKTVAVVHDRKRDDGHDHDEFLLLVQ